MSILKLLKCSKDNLNSLLKWDITQDTNGNISIASERKSSAWVGANITGSTVAVPWLDWPGFGSVRVRGSQGRT